MIGAQAPQRIDKWLWHARAIRTRSAAARLVTAGRVRLNGARVVKPSTLVGAGDVLTFALAGRVRVLRVCGAAERRGPAIDAAVLYVDLSPPPQPADDANGPRPAGAGRPTKRNRRRIDALTGPDV